MNYDWLLFDADNTILDFDEAQRQALAQALAAIGISFLEAHHQVYDRINRECWRAYEEGTLSKQELQAKRFQNFFLEIGEKQDAADFGKTYIHFLSRSTAMMNGAVALLDVLKQKYRLALVTNGIKEVQRSRIHLSGIAPYFSFIAISDEIGVSKPHEGFFTHVFEGINHPSKERTLIIGDNLNADIKGGLAFGIHACWFNYDQRERYLEVEPTYEIAQLSELLAIL